MSAEPWSPEQVDALGECIDTGVHIHEAMNLLQRSEDAIYGRAHRQGWKYGEPRRPEQRSACPPLRAPAPKVRRVRSSKCQVNVLFDPETIEEIAAEAKRQGMTRTALIRQFVEWGLMGEALTQ